MDSINAICASISVVGGLLAGCLLFFKEGKFFEAVVVWLLTAILLQVAR